MFTKRIISTQLSQGIHTRIMEVIEEATLASLCEKLPPRLTSHRHKGQSGRIGVIGGSLDYTGAPYFAGISALKVGADLTHVFCTSSAASVIKGYSPELIVHPLLDNSKTVELAVQWIERLHVVVVGPGLGRMPEIFDAVTVLLKECRRLLKPLIIDADGLFLIMKFPEVIENYPAEVILTPNLIEFSRLSNSSKIKSEMIDRFGQKCTVIRKGEVDEIFDSKIRSRCTSVGSPRRCGGQGDLLSGALATFLCWALSSEQNMPELQLNFNTDLRSMLACYAACKLTRECSNRAFKLHGRSMTSSDMIAQIGGVFQDFFEPN